MEHDTTVRIDAALAAVPPTMTVYRTEGPRTFARGDRDVRDLVAKRVRRWTEAFPTDAEPRDLGDRVLLIDDRQALEVFVPTESMWWSNRATAFAEQPPSEPLPGPEAAAAEALAAIGRLDASGADWTVARVGTVNAGMSRSPDYPGELVATMVTVVLGLIYDGLPVVGPGARTRVSFGGGGEQLGRGQQGGGEPVNPVRPGRRRRSRRPQDDDGPRPPRRPPGVRQLLTSAPVWRAPGASVRHADR